MRFAEFERSLINSRLSGGRRTKARGGLHAGGRIPLGYRAEGKALVLDLAEAMAVRRAFELREAGMSLKGVAEALNAVGYITKTGKGFSKVQIKRILDREALYRGEYEYSGIKSPGKHEAIL